MKREIIDENPPNGHGTVYAIVHEPSGRRYRRSHADTAPAQGAAGDELGGQAL